MKRRVLTAALVLLAIQLRLSAQDLSQQVSLQFRQVPLERVLQEVGERYDLRFSYGGQLQALQKKVSIAGAELPLGEFLFRALDQGGLTYKQIGGVLVLRPQEGGPLPAGAAGLPEESSSQRTPGPQESVLVPAPLPRMERRTPAASTTVPLAAAGPLSLPQGQLGVSVPGKPLPPPVSPGRRASRFRLGPVVSLELARLKASGPYAQNQELNPLLGFSLGGSAFRQLTKRVGLQLGLLYRRQGFDVHYRLQMEGGPFGLPQRTAVTLGYLELPLELQLGLLRYKRFVLHGTAGLRGSLLLRKEEATWLDDGRLFPTTEMQLRHMSPFLWGVRGGLSLHYALRAQLHCFLSPVYTYTGGELKGGAQAIRQQEWGLQSGLRIGL